MPGVAAPSGWSFEGFAGYTDTTESFGDEVVYGLRGGRRLRPHLALELAVERDERSSHFLTMPQVAVETDLTFLDLSVVGFVNPGERAEWYFLGGPGWGWREREVRFPMGLHATGSADWLTAHVGTGVRIGLGRRAYLRPELRWRWSEKVEDGGFSLDETTDFELTLAVGVAVGPR